MTSETNKWDISCPFTMANPDSATSLSQHASSSRSLQSNSLLVSKESKIHRTINWRQQNICQPEVDIVDGIAFCAFENESDLKKFTLQDENSKKQANIKPEKMKRTYTPRRPAVNGNLVSTPMDHSPALLKAMPSPPPLYKKEIPIAMRPSTSTGVSKSSAFVSDILDQYLSQTKDELKSSEKQIIEHIGSPPEDSPIYSAGILKADEKERTPFADLPLLGKGTEMGQLNENNKRPRQRWPDTHEDESFVEKVIFRRKKKVKPNVPIPQPVVKQVKTEWKENSTTESKVAKEDAVYSLYQLEKRFHELTKDTFDAIQASRKPYHVSFKMDDSYARYALDAVQLPPKPQISRTDPLATTPKKSDSNGSAKSVKKRESKEADIATIISRHSKRDIRLPARYHQSGLILGSQWVIPGFESSPEKKKRKLCDEQKRLMKPLKPIESSLVYKELYEELEKFQKTTKVLPAPRATITKVQLAPKKPETNTSVADSIIRKIHEERLEQLKQLKSQQMKTQNSPMMSSLKIGDQLYRKGINRVIKYIPRPVATVSRPIQQYRIVSPEKKVFPEPTPDKKKGIKEIYRMLFYENLPKRRAEYAQKGIKPRVNKKQVIEEGVTVIRELEESQLIMSRAKDLMQGWNNKLQQCVKVLSHTESKEPIEKRVQVVESVLARYRDSVAYKKLMGTYNPTQQTVKKTYVIPAEKNVQIIQPTKPASQPPTLFVMNKQELANALKNPSYFKSKAASSLLVKPSQAVVLTSGGQVMFSPGNSITMKPATVLRATQSTAIRAANVSQAIVLTTANGSVNGSGQKSLLKNQRMVVVDSNGNKQTQEIKRILC
ncbi:hypothetical protein HDE_02825 [Halotydeus destructor]|nr:hypothetical protein HDE_02825 [Halotydeus destructor]